MEICQSGVALTATSWLHIRSYDAGIKQLHHFDMLQICILKRTDERHLLK